MRPISCISVSPVFSRTNVPAASDHPSLKLVVSAEIQICRTGRLRADDKARIVRVVKLDFQLAASALDLEPALIAHFLQAALERVKRGIAPFLEFMFIHDESRLH